MTLMLPLIAEYNDTWFPHPTVKICDAYVQAHIQGEVLGVQPPLIF